MYKLAAKKILVCPLNWGLGHATRCVPLIRHFLADGKEVVIAADGYPLSFLREEFSELTFIEFLSYRITYSKNNSQVWAMLRCLPNVVAGIVREHRQLKKIVAEQQIDCVLSDNRFGLWHEGVHSIYMTHQLMIKMPRGLRLFEPLAAAVHRFFINKYDVCLVPDEWENGGWAGDLTHRYPLPENARFIGILSRFSSTCHSDESQNPLWCEGIAGQARNDRTPKVLAIVSGIEPQRSIFEKILIEELSKKDFQSLIVCGQPTAHGLQIRASGNASIVSHLSSEEMEFYLQNTPTVICRSGYSSIMDLLTLGCTAILVPTPGQTEQEYLAEYLSKEKGFVCVKQSELWEYLRKKYC
ncbi:glycosyl transferase [Bacteroidia bacterium]|nr:glycosyl transferase [Bacteroidia bacterium]